MNDMGFHRYSKGYWRATREYERTGKKLPERMAKQLEVELVEIERSLKRIRRAVVASLPTRKGNQ